MERTLCGALLALVVLTAATGAQVGETREPAAPIVERFLARLSAAAGLRADFVQVNHWAVMDEADTSRGVLTVTPPDRFRLEYAEPAGHLVGSDGRFVWTVVPEERQVLRADLAATTGWGNFFLEAFYAGADSTVEVRRGSGGMREALLELGARPAWGVLAMSILLDVDRAVPLAYAYTDEEGNRYRFDFLSIDFPEKLPEATYQFVLPAGYEILDVD